MVQTTVSVIKADIGSSPGHIVVYDPLMEKAEQLLAKAQDTKGSIGPEETYSITIKKSKSINTQFFKFLLDYLEFFPFLQILLQRLG